MPSAPISISEFDHPGGLRALLRHLVDGPTPRNRRRALAFAYTLTLVVGVADFFTGIQVSLLVFYFVPVAIGVAASGSRSGVLIALFSVLTWLASDFAAGAHYASLLIPCWNALIAFVTYLVLVWLLSGLLSLHRELEQRVRQRTTALRNEMAERERLEKAVLDIGERERFAIGRDLHDGLGQHLTGTALLAQAAARDLEQRSAAEAPQVTKVVSLIEQGIEQTRNLARGLLSAAIEHDGLVPACSELCSTISGQFRVKCDFEVIGNPQIADGGVASHLYCIVQEAVRNAARHSGATRVDVSIVANVSGITCTIRDDGRGLPPQSSGSGLGLQIMAHRAGIIGATFSLTTPPEGGTEVVCHLPAAGAKARPIA
ncbi:MAG TPA: sensor histidine kinase [Opitutaceae bacterium]|jgi:signal transduction histidine kinase